MAKKRKSGTRSPKETSAGRGSRKGLPRKGQAARELIAQLKTHLTKDLSEQELAEVLGLTVLRLRTLMERMYSSEEAALQGKTPVRLYVDYVARQLACIHKLDEVADACLAGNQAAGAVGAIKAKADLYHRLLTTGQDLGVLAKRPKEVHLVGKIDVRHLTTEDLRRQVAAENAALLKLAASLDAPAADRALLVEAAGGNGNDSANAPKPKGRRRNATSSDPGGR